MIANAAEHLAIQDINTSATEPAMLKLIDDGHAHFEATGLHVTTTEVRAWLTTARLNPDAPRPACHV
jgi:predicted transcriptional regulator